MLTQARLKELIVYDPETGLVAQKPRKGVSDTSFKSGADHNRGYKQIGVAKKVHLVHRLAWLYMTGEWPANDVDHINGDRADNRWANLRQATSAENKCNSRMRSDNTSGVKGISWEAKANRWRAEIWHEGKKHYVGVSKNIDELLPKLEARRKELHGAFARQ